MKPHQSYGVKRIQEDLYHVVKIQTRRIIHVMRTEAAAELAAEELNRAALESYIDGASDACRELQEQLGGGA